MGKENYWTKIAQLMPELHKIFETKILLIFTFR